jgi:Protein of unknown function (DUF2806)
LRFFKDLYISNNFVYSSQPRSGIKEKPLDLPGEKLIIKMWETLTEKGIGSLLTPWNLKREGKARNEVRRAEILMLAQAETDAADVRAGRKHLQGDGTLLLTSSISQAAAMAQDEVSDRIEPTLSLPAAIRTSEITAAVENARREINTAKAVLYAEEQLAGDPQQPPSREIEEDWLFAWRDYAGRVAAEDLQRLWGSVLAGEVKSPGKYSMRTLECLKTLSKPDAEKISKLARYSIGGRIARSQADYLNKQGINLDFLLGMQEMGVVSGVESVGLNVTYYGKQGAGEKFVEVLLSNSKALVVEHENALKTLELEVYVLTAVGSQILELGKFEPDIEYLNLVGKQMAAQGFRVHLCDWQRLSEVRGIHFNPVRIDA